MAYTQPMIYKINAFDVNDIATIPELLVGFTGLENPPNIISCVLDVYNNDTGNLINNGNKEANLYLNDTSEDLSIYTCSLSQPDPDNPSPVLSTFTGLDNGNSYYIIVTLPTDVTGGDPIISNGLIFSCYSKPSFTITSIEDGDIIKQNALKINFIYNQINNVELNWYQCDLYLGGELVNSSGKLYDENYSYTFQNLINGAQYSFIVSGSTIDNFNFESNIITFNVNYQVIQDSTLIKLENVAKEGYIKVNSNFNLIPGTLNNSKLENGNIDTRDTNSDITWGQNFEINKDNIILKSWNRLLNNNSNIIELSNTNNTDYINVVSKQGNIGQESSPITITLEGSNVGLNSIVETQLINENSTQAKYIGYYYNSINYYLVYSNDLISWYYCKNNGNNIQVNSSFQERFISYVNNTYYTAVGREVYYSSDGITWTNVSLEQNILPLNIIYDGTQYFAYGYNGYCYAANSDFSNAVYVYNLNNYSKVFYNNGLFVAVVNNTGGFSANIYKSSDGINWSLCSGENGNILAINDFRGCSIKYFNNKFLIYYTSANNIMNCYSSQDGNLWKLSENTGYYYYYSSNFYHLYFIDNNIIYNVSPFTNQGVMNTRVSYSLDGLKWKQLIVIPRGAFNNFLSIVKVGQNIIMAAHDSNTLSSYSYSLIYDNYYFEINANIDNTLTTANTNQLTNVYFEDWIYIGINVVYNNSITINSIVKNQQDSPGGV